MTLSLPPVALSTSQQALDGSHDLEGGRHSGLSSVSPVPVARVAHKEKHFTGALIVRDMVIGLSDGLTVPFALAAGLSAAFGSSSFVVKGGLAEIVAGSISMGLGG